jgi:predicted kinase
MIPTLMMTCGVQGSGKSTWAKQYIKENPDTLYISTDKMREELGAGAHDQTVNSMIFPLMRRKVETALSQGNVDILLDATFIKKSWRKEYVNLGRKYGAWLIAHIFNADRDVLIKRVQQRAKNGGLDVPVEAIDKYIAGFEPPTKDEFDEIIKH